MCPITPEQRRAIERAGGEPVRLEDPETQEAYVLISAERYEAMKAPPGEDAPEEMDAFLDETFREGWDDPALDVYNELDPRRDS